MKNKKTILTIMVICIILAVIITLIILSIKKDNKPEPNVTPSNHIETAEEKNTREIEELKGMGETSRMQFYVSKYISYLEEGDYESAYNLLYDEFKQNYFKTQEEFTTYVKNKYSDIITLDYEKTERLGPYYVVTVNFKDLINDTKNYTQLFVLKENGFNDFVLSFQAT